MLSRSQSPVSEALSRMAQTMRSILSLKGTGRPVDAHTLRDIGMDRIGFEFGG